MWGYKPQVKRGSWPQKTAGVPKKETPDGKKEDRHISLAGAGKGLYGRYLP